MTANKKDYKTLVLPPKYQPKKTDKYMSDEHKAYFYQLLMAEKKELEDEIAEAAVQPNLGQKMDAVGAMDEGDVATLSLDADLSIKIQERSAHMLNSVIKALERLEDGSYGYSVISGDEIGLKRLMARPTAAVTVEEKEAAEK